MEQKRRKQKVGYQVVYLPPTIAVNSYTWGSSRPRAKQACMHKVDMITIIESRLAVMIDKKMGNLNFGIHTAKSENDEKRSHRQKDSTYHAWQVALPLPIGAKDGRACATQELPQTVGIALPSVIGLIVARLDYLQCCLALKKEEQSRATD
ncbi:hypothetical protein M9H77_18440 [Catharanthus roseus]|uniref:Uncharacterized protein n=1 Tax=Catharanthus roseus TaxID=4058 RepID=A0ACC0B7M3_CATRO|nr:hypothetical protein M9H77_18440 [Catharanthus roseus]